MPRTKKPKFKVGDAVESTAKNEWIPKGEKGIVTEVRKSRLVNYQNTLTNRTANVCFVKVFGRIIKPLPSLASDLRLCKGMSSKKFCYECEYFFECPSFRLICRTNGKLDEKLCKPCRYKYKCFSSRESDC